MHIHSTTSQWNKTLYDPYVNMLRTTTETMSAAIGGSEIITTGPFDQVWKAADEFSYHIARNQQILLKEESWLDKVADPAAGSYYLETLTDQLAEKAWDLFREIEEKGGMIACIEQGFIQQSLLEILSTKSDDVATRKMVFLGTNQYPNMSEVMYDQVKPSPDTTTKKETPFIPLQFSRATAAFEKLRLQTEQFVASSGKRPSVFLFNYGSLAHQKARASFATNFFACAGFEVIDNAGFNSIEDGVAASAGQQPSVIVFCSSDEEYPALIPQACRELRVKCPQSILVVAGYPKDQLEALAKEGIHDYIHVRSNLLHTLADFQLRLGIRKNNA
jgi:methylmalonyl-CoA mutase